MARNFNGSSDLIIIAEGMTQAMPSTIIVRFQHDNDDGTDYIFDDDGSDRHLMTDDASTNTRSWYIDNTIIWNNATPVWALASAWHIFLGRMSSGDQDARIDEASLATETKTLASMGAPPNHFIGRRKTAIWYFAGGICDYASCNFKLSTVQCDAIARGVSIFGICGGNLDFWLPLLGNDDPEPNWSSGGVQNSSTGALTGTSKTKNPSFELIENYL